MHPGSPVTNDITPDTVIVGTGMLLLLLLLLLFFFIFFFFLLSLSQILKDLSIRRGVDFHPDLGSGPDHF